MSRLALLLLVVVMLGGCGGRDAPGAASTSSPTPAPSVTSSPSAAPFTPTRAEVRSAGWRLPYAAGRQAVVPLAPGHVLVAGGLRDGDASTDRVVSVDLAHGVVAGMPPLAVPVHDVAGGLAAGVPLVVGGGNATEQDVVQALHGPSWRVVGHLPTARSDLSVVQHGRGTWVLGGYDGSSTPTSILDVGAAGSSRPAGRLVQGVRYAATAVAGHAAYVFGGEVGGAELDTVQAVDLRTGRSRVVARLPVPLGHAMAATTGRRILLVGGRTSPDRRTDAIWWFDPATGSFRRAGRLPRPLSDAAVATWGRRVWLLGGEDPSPSAGVLTISVR